MEIHSNWLNEQAMIKVRLDVDYPYPSRAKSFLFLALGIKRKSRNYLKNSKIIARMFNESPKQIMAYWFFTPYTIPDKKLLTLLIPERHDVGLHVAVDPYREWKILENETHSTSQILHDSWDIKSCCPVIVGSKDWTKESEDSQ